MRFSNVLVFSSVLLAAPSVSVAAPGDASSAAAFLTRTAQALHAQRLPQLHGWHAALSGTAAGLPATADLWVDPAMRTSANYMRLASFSQDNGYDGRDPWTRDDKGVVWDEGSRVGRSEALNDAFRQAYTLWSPGAGGATVTAGSTTENAVRYDVLHVAIPGSTVPFDVWLDTSTFLPVRYVESASGITTTTTLSHYAAVGGVLLPYAIAVVTSQGNPTTFTAQRIDANPAGLAEHLRKPVRTVADYGITGGTTTTVPFDLIDNHVYLNVTLNGKGPYRFIFDTGGQNVVDPAVAREIGATAKGSMQGGGVGAETEQFSFTKVASLRLGAAELRDQSFGVLPVRAGFGVSASAPVDGLIGWEVLARFVTTFDYANDTVVLGTAPAPALPSTIPFVYNGTQPEVACTLNDIASRCAVDTGSRSSLDIFRPFALANPGVAPAQLTAAGVDGFGVGGASVGRLGRLRSLDIAGYRLSDLVAGYSLATAGAFAGEGVAANIGGAVWKRFTVTFDYPHQTMTLVPIPAAFAVRDAYERAGLFAINRAGKVVIADVRPGTPAAAAGLVKGDVISSLDGVADALTLAKLRAALRGAPGTVVRLGVVHDTGPAVERTVTLRDYV